MTNFNNLQTGVSSDPLYDKTGVSGSSPEWPTTSVVPVESFPGTTLALKGGEGILMFHFPDGQIGKRKLLNCGGC